MTFSTSAQPFASSFLERKTFLNFHLWDRKVETQLTIENFIREDKLGKNMISASTNKHVKSVFGSTGVKPTENMKLKNTNFTALTISYVHI